MTKQPSFAQDMFMVICGCIVSIMVVAFLALPHNISMHFGEASQLSAAAASYHLT